METSSSLGRHDGPNLESSGSGIHWSSILGGAAVAAAVSLTLIPLGSAFDLASFSVFTATTKSAAVFTAGMAIWLVVMQWISGGVGGYIAGRLRVKWADLHSDEVFFRDTAHGFIAWAVATLVTAVVIIGATVSGLGAATDAGSKVVASATDNNTLSYYSDSLFRGATGSTSDVTAETSRILANDVANGETSTADEAYLTHQVAAHTGLPEAQAKTRVDTVVAQLRTLKQKAVEAAEAARKTLVGFFTALFISLLVGAFIAGVSAALGGRLRDKY